jgi:hypothetical protein
MLRKRRKVRGIGVWMIRESRQRALGIRRAFAAITIVWFVLGGVLGARHESRVAHFTDAHSGATLHASKMIGNHSGHRPDVHTSGRATFDHECTIVSAIHQAARPELARVAVALALEVVVPANAPQLRAAIASQLVYRLAPKTSPPLVA